MKYLIFIACLFISILLTAQTVFQQEKRDYIWLMGYNDNTMDSLYGGTKINFNTNPPTVTRDTILLNFESACSVMCDTAGNLLFYSNNLQINNFLNSLIEEGDNLNPNSNAYHSRLPQGILSLPMPGNDSLYFLFHAEIHIVNDFDWLRVRKLYYSVVDMSANGGMGKVIEKNIPLIEDELEYGQITACRHANGRDWWIIVPKKNSNIYYIILLGVNGVEQVKFQEIGTDIDFSLGQAVFSPNGSKYARLSRVNSSLPVHINIYNFDRCKGELSNSINIEYTLSLGPGGIAFSPNSRFIYAVLIDKILQYDLDAVNIEESGLVIAVYDGYYSPFEPFATYFFFCQLAPDNKIYITTPSSTDILHIIHFPDSLGVLAQVEQHGLQLPTLNASTIPNQPNYRLGPWDGCPCDTLGIDNEGTVSYTPPPVASSSAVRLYPNPVRDDLWIHFDLLPEEATVLEIFDILGQPVLRLELLQSVTTVSLYRLPAGTYLGVVSRDGQVLRSQPFVKVE